jgi:hypothetical protein
MANTCREQPAITTIPAPNIANAIPASRIARRPVQVVALSAGGPCRVRHTQLFDEHFHALFDVVADRSDVVHGEAGRVG